MKNKMKYENYRVNKSDIKFINDNNNIKGMKLYRVLKNKRLYGVNSEVGCFDVKREDIVVGLREKWEYYAYKSPIWKKRFDKYKVKVDDKKRRYCLVMKMNMMIFMRNITMSLMSRIRKLNINQLKI